MARRYKNERVDVSYEGELHISLWITNRESYILQDRAVNKVDYDRKLRFWTDTIYASCVGEKNAVFDLLVLKRRFRRKDKIPASLNIVLERMKE